MGKIEKSGLVLLLLVLNFILLADSENNVAINDTPKETVKEVAVIDSFQDFELLWDKPLMTSIKTNQSVAFNHSGMNIGSRDGDYYYLRLDSYNNISDFEAQVDIQYSFLGTGPHGGVIMTCGSYYREDGDYYNDVLPDSGKVFAHCGAFHLDGYGYDNGGSFISAADPFDEQEFYRTSSGTVVSPLNLTLFLKRTNSKTLTVTILNNNVVKQNYTWTEGLTRPLNYIRIGTYTEHGYDGMVYSEFANFTLKINSIYGNDWEGSKKKIVDRFGFQASMIASLLLIGFLFHIFGFLRIIADYVDRIRQLKFILIAFGIAATILAISLASIYFPRDYTGIGTYSIANSIYFGIMTTLILTYPFWSKIFDNFSSRSRTRTFNSRDRDVRNRKVKDRRRLILFFIGISYLTALTIAGSVFGFLANRFGVGYGLLSVSIVFFVIIIGVITLLIINRRKSLQ